ncbi:MAG: hypothetical protein II992_00220 [Lachnospiraceae bacterium]|nr:hypothetical protein [Lachnospiraceae bacterium]
MISKMERMVKEDMAGYILEELCKSGCVLETRKETAKNVITKALVDIRKHKTKLSSNK